MTPPDTTLATVVAKYKSLTGGAFGVPVALSAFDWAPSETERVFSLFDEDYHISRHFHFTMESALGNVSGRTYQINGFPQTHVSLDAKIAAIL